MAVYIAKVLIAFEADDLSDACDAVSAALSENLQHAGAILDWSYHADITENGGEYDYSAPRRTAYAPKQVCDDGFGADLNPVFNEAEQCACHACGGDPFRAHGCTSCGGTGVVSEQQAKDAYFAA